MNSLRYKKYVELLELTEATDSDVLVNSLKAIAPVLKKQVKTLNAEELKSLQTAFELVKKNIKQYSSDKQVQKQMIRSIDASIKALPILVQANQQNAEKASQDKQTQVANTIDYSSKLPGAPTFNAQWHQMAIDANKADPVKGNILVSYIKKYGDDFFNGW